MQIRNDSILGPSDMTVDTWFKSWQENMSADLAPNIRRNYRERYIHTIQPAIGGMPNKNSSYDTRLYKLCDEAEILRFCVHALRHTYATCENGV